MYVCIYIYNIHLYYTHTIYIYIYIHITPSLTPSGSCQPKAGVELRAATRCTLRTPPGVIGARWWVVFAPHRAKA